MAESTIKFIFVGRKVYIFIICKEISVYLT